MLNFNVRFLYEFFLELCICVCINLFGAKDGGSRALWAFSVLALLALICLVAFVASLFLRGGPYLVPSSYQDGTLFQSFWGLRPLKNDCTEAESVNEATENKPSIESKTKPTEALDWLKSKKEQIFVNQTAVSPKEELCCEILNDEKSADTLR